MGTWLVRLRDEWVRTWVSVAVSVPVAVAIVAVSARTLDGAVTDVPFLRELLGWVCWALAYAALTYGAFRTATHEDLRALPEKRRSGWRRLLGKDRTAGPQFAVLLAASALAGAALLFRSDTATSTAQQVLLVVTVTLAVVVAWVILALGYAVHYARLDATAEATHLRFPGDEPPAFDSYLYFALSVSTTFGTTDVTVLTATMRRTVTGHAVAAFVFNTLILALVVAGLAR